MIVPTPSVLEVNDVTDNASANISTDNVVAINETNVIEAANETNLEVAPALEVAPVEATPSTLTVTEVVTPSPESTPSTSVATTADSANTSCTTAMPTIINLDNVRALNPTSFPNLPRKESKLRPCTLANVSYMLDAYGITIRYNVISKKVYTTIPGVTGTPDNADNVAITYIFSLANLNEVSTGQLLSLIGVIGDKNRFNPVADWITSKPWDGVDRIIPFYDTLVHRADFPVELKHALIYRWLLSAVAAALKVSCFKARGVLTLQGPQSIGKTTWISALVPDEILREAVIKLDHHLDAGNKDSIITAVSNWIVEIGELDSSFKKDIARLKGFLTSGSDKVRRPYGRVDSEYPRRTVFCATVNEDQFLVDSTGNSRWWTIPVSSVNYEHGIDMQQLFAQLAVDFNNDTQWWLTRAEEALLEHHNKNHRVMSVIRERLLSAIEMDRINEEGLIARTPTEALQYVDIRHPTNTQSKECASVLRELFGDSKRINGLNKWRIPFRSYDWEPLSSKATTSEVSPVSKATSTYAQKFPDDAF